MNLANLAAISAGCGTPNIFSVMPTFTRQPGESFLRNVHPKATHSQRNRMNKPGDPS